MATRVSFFLFSCCLFGDYVDFSEYFLHHFSFLFVLERTSYVLSFRRMVFFYLVTTGNILVGNGVNYCKRSEEIN